jgi:hypothetical protein
MSIMTEKELFELLQRSQDNSTLFAKIRNTIEELLYIAEIADNAELLSFYQQSDLLRHKELLEELNSNYEKFYNIFESQEATI